ncbi:hypothetical protein COLO4_05211 [Corchorus olitorius]|uniref:Uncharacterized protein n=1 Tax=Corchorus olitorius TaxID=93759 RepID=A0A1R3KRI2_9ROSI|nr:hypothetical protein COLO4_05211 [Corchorus olitorius]
MIPDGDSKRLGAQAMQDSMNAYKEGEGRMLWREKLCEPKKNVGGRKMIEVLVGCVSSDDGGFVFAGTSSELAEEGTAESVTWEQANVVDLL